MKKLLVAGFLIALTTVLVAGCGPKKLPPGEPQVDVPPPKPGEPTPKPPEPTPEKPQEPEPPAKPPLQAPAPKPRTPSKGDPASAKLIESGTKQLNAGNLDGAEQMFEQALRVSPTNGKPYYYLAVISIKQKNYERALGFLQQAETFLHNDDFWMAQILVQEGLALKAMNRASEAREKFKGALERDPDNQAAAKELKALGSKQK